MATTAMPTGPDTVASPPGADAEAVAAGTPDSYRRLTQLVVEHTQPAAVAAVVAATAEVLSQRWQHQQQQQKLSQ